MEKVVEEQDLALQQQFPTVKRLLICTSEFQNLKLHEPLRQVQFQLSEKLTSAN